MPRSVYSSSYEHFRQLLIASRKSAGFTQSELATRLNRPQSYVSKYESGERRLDVVEFLEIADVLSLDIHALIDSLHNHLHQSPSET